MEHVIIKILPIIALFVLGFFLKKVGIVNKRNADLLMKFVFFISLPAIMFISVLHIEISIELLYLTIIPVIIIFIMGIISFITGKYLNLFDKDFGVFIVGIMIMNVGFTYPFIIAAYGEEGLARISFFNFSNALLTFTVTYYLACRYGNGKTNWGSIIKKLLLSFPLWALIFAVICNFFNFSISTNIENFFSVVGNLTVPLIMLSLGIYFTPKIINPKPFTLMIIIRQIGGLLIGIILIKIFQLKDLNAVIVIIGSSAPVGYNTLVFSTLEGLNKEFAASVVSFSLLIGIIYIPILMFVFEI
ncbi:MAG: AEC family transporter [Candidatus Pacebacteria bacterium]|nr:AEC family transporter [Candidatus Paceibacterota bacterium]